MRHERGEEDDGGEAQALPRGGDAPGLGGALKRGGEGAGSSIRHADLLFASWNANVL